MIDYISGTVTALHKNEVTIFTGSFGLVITVPDPSCITLHGTIQLYTHLYWHTENGPSLFGFHSPIDKKIFLLLLSCPGIGPKIAVSALGEISSFRLLYAIAHEDVKTVAQAPGIGTKKAETLIVALKTKALSFIKEHNIVSEGSSYLLDVQEALESLGYSKQEIKYAMSHISSDTKEQEKSFDQQLRKALGYLHLAQKG